MVIEALIRGQVMARQVIPDEYLEFIEGANWSENVKAREELIAHNLALLKLRMEPFFNPAFQIDYRLVISSKMNKNNDDD